MLFTKADGGRRPSKLIGIGTALIRAHFLMKLRQDWIEFFLLECLGSIFRQVRCQSRDPGVRWTSSGCRFFEGHLSQALGDFDAHGGIVKTYSVTHLVKERRAATRPPPQRW